MIDLSSVNLTGNPLENFILEGCGYKMEWPIQAPAYLKVNVDLLLDRSDASRTAKFLLVFFQT